MMKHIKAYKIFESKEEILDLKDISLEISDEGINVNVSGNYDYRGIGLPESYLNSITIAVGNWLGLFKSKSILECVLRMIDYMRGYKVNMKIEYNHNSGAILKKQITAKDLENDDYELRRLYITFYKPLDTFRIIWINKNDRKTWGIYKSNFDSREEAQDYLNILVKDLYHDNAKRYGNEYKIISDKQYWVLYNKY